MEITPSVRSKSNLQLQLNTASGKLHNTSREKIDKSIPIFPPTICGLLNGCNGDDIPKPKESTGTNRLRSQDASHPGGH